MKYLLALFTMLALSAPAMAQYDIYANDGTYLGNTGSQYDPNSINNPYGKYGSQYSPNSINNQYGSYGSQYSTTSPTNQYAQPARMYPVNGGPARSFGGSPYVRY